MNTRPADNIESIINLLKEAVFVYDENLEIRYFNEAAERITGYRREEVLGRKCITILDQSVCLNNCELCLTVKKGINYEAHFTSSFLRKDGAKRMGEFQAGLLQRNEEGTRVVVALNDVTEISQLRQELKEVHSFGNMIGKSRVMKELFETIQNVAFYDSTVFIQGESGTGKELVARALHYASPRAGKNLIKVNCTAFADTLLESELFGHAKGAFTGALRDRIGRFEEAHGGTIFLDEIGDLTPTIQVKLLRVLQEKEVERVGENVTRQVDIRIIAATNKDILEEVKTGRFREDLYYRLNVIPLHLPPLRERREDIPYLVQHFIKRWNAQHVKPIEDIADDALGLLLDHNWPGNIRELENVVEHACVKCSGSRIHSVDLPAFLQSESALPGRKKGNPVRRRNWLNRELVTEALARAEGNQSRAARELGVHRITLWRKMKEFGIPA
ncbi:PAS domain S-box protein [Nitrospina gracilis 3/211]|uniref:PAS domain S-box protein n=1 Tax=Nitrospina gracilis (strain 3/211) TaxID=1266370 RepID=M1YUG5_NITG3|nr:MULTISPECIES: sigma-54-dependent Fis family transcriptional regulator [Nitrospina]MCF8722542.1 PAS domain S-box-containing protein [Nitrospina sp. Nb-3]CCQ89222.1 PAS domain S-box protein [Nitrospina gracilis 3/211]